MTWVRPGPTRRQVTVDVVLAVVLAASSLLTLQVGRAQGAMLGGPPPSALEQTLWALAVTLPVALRRVRPVTTLLVVSGVFIGLQARFVPETLLCSIALYTAVFTAGAWGPDRRRSTVARAVVVVVMFSWLTYGLLYTTYAEMIPDQPAADGAFSPRNAYLVLAYVFNAIYFGAAIAFGELAWRAAAQRSLLEQRTVELEAERREVARRSREAERLVLARDLHDVVAHHVSLMGVQAGAARRAFDRDPTRAREALTQVERTSRAAVEEMRRMLSLLRGESDSGAPAVTALPHLVEQTGSSGLRVELTVVGTPRDLPPSVSASAYRVVQEALTNTLKHAAATHADVRLRYLDAAIEVEVVDDGRGAAPDPPAAARGQAGMAERVALHDGELEVGPRPARGYRVRARFPTATSG